jgi:Flp pilus assembly protein TadG
MRDPSPTRSPRRSRHGLRSTGQSLVEFALVVPVLLLILLVAIDFGRAFYSWVILQNAARIGANYAGVNADAWKADPDDATIVGTYNALIEEDAGRAFCDESWGSGDPPSPVFTDSPADTAGAGQTPDTSYDVGDSTKVSLTCDFHLLTPIISSILGGDVELGASSEFRIRAGDIAGLDNASAIPPPSNSTPTPTPTSTPAPTATATATASCLIVPDLVHGAGGSTETVGEARAEWSATGFTGGLLPNGQNHATVLTQDKAVGACIGANSTVTVTHD